METRDPPLSLLGELAIDADFDEALQGLGRGGHRIMIWDGDDTRQIEGHWGLKSRDPDVGQIPLLKSETARIENPCLILANEFGIKRDGKTLYAASLVTDVPFFASQASGNAATATGRTALRR